MHTYNTITILKTKFEVSHEVIVETVQDSNII
jgi:hypothetical protein